MRALHLTALLLFLLAPNAFAERLYQVELLVFRQAGEPLTAPRPAPDDWAGNALPATASERTTSLNAEADRLTPANGYQLLLHKAWTQSVGSNPSSVAVSSGEAYFGHYPVEGQVTLNEDRFTALEMELWINHFSDDGLLESSEHLQLSQRLKDNALTYLDHGSLGALIRLSPL